MLKKAGQTAPMNTNVVNTQRPGAMRASRVVSDALAGGPGGSGLVPVRAIGAGGQFASKSSTVLPGSGAVFQQLQGSAIASSSDLEDSSACLWQANHTVFPPGGDGCKGGMGSPCYDGVNEAQIWADSTQAAPVCPDFEHFGDATDSSTAVRSLREQGGMIEGQEGGVSGVVRGAGAPRQSNVDPSNVTTFQWFPAVGPLD